MKRVLVIALTAIVVCVFAAGACNAQALNPYLPHNAVTAEPLEPYNLWLIPQCSRTHYVPCPTCYCSFSSGLPDVPIQWAVRGCLGIWVPVP